jgi:hypothetical protein
VDARQFFLDQHSFVEGIVRDFVLGALTEDQLRMQPREGQNPLVWLLWHAARWEDVLVNTWVAEQTQVIDTGGHLRLLGVGDRHAGTAMTSAESLGLGARIQIEPLYGYWQEVGRRTREVVTTLTDADLCRVVTEGRLREGAADGVAGNPRAPWLEQFFGGRTVAGLLAFLNVHNTEHMIGEALCVRSLGGIALGL